MSLGISAATWGLISAGVAAVGTVNAVHQGNMAQKQQTTAQNQAKAAALKQEKLAEQDMNRRNRKSPNLQSILAGNANGRAGVSGTMLTGPQGVASSDLSLGKSSLLGG